MTPSSSAPPDATLLLSAAAGGSQAAVAQLLPLVYEQLRQTAKLSLASERPGHTLSATVLVHETYLKLVGPRRVPWANRAHFYAAAVEAMRRILFDHAKSRLRQKRLTSPNRSPLLARTLWRSASAHLATNNPHAAVAELQQAVRAASTQPSPPCPPDSSLPQLTPSPLTSPPPPTPPSSHPVR